MIFLDMLRNKYIGVRGPELAALSKAVLGRPTIDNDLAQALKPEHVTEWVSRLRDQKLISETPCDRPQLDSPCLEVPMTSLMADGEQAMPAPDWRQLVRLWRSVLVTSAWMRRRNLAEIAERIAALRSRHEHQAAHADMHADAMRSAVTSYMFWRPFALTTHDRCLNDSLALIHFMASQALFPHWVIGVKVRPFGAHSWVQSGSVVLNDLPERVRHYEPILVV